MEYFIDGHRIDIKVRVVEKDMMVKQLQPNKYTCLPTCLAMCIDRPVQELLTLLGRDGSNIAADGEPEYFKSRDIINFALTLGYAVISHPFVETVMRNDFTEEVKNDLAYTLLDNTSGYRSILMYTEKNKWVGHVIAGDGKDTWFDPTTGCQVGLPDAKRFDLICLMTVHKIKSNSEIPLK